jgi:ribosomal protein S18 acetylase RimI-like enzyme
MRFGRSHVARLIGGHGYDPAMRIRRMEGSDVDAVLAAGDLFDDPPRREWTETFLGRGGHHLLFAEVDGTAAGFVSGIEITHPDKGTEMLLYELGVDEPFRRRGIGRALVRALLDLATELDCVGMWVPVDPDETPAHATYRAAGGSAPEASTIVTWEIA